MAEKLPQTVGVDVLGDPRRNAFQSLNGEFYEVEIHYPLERVVEGADPYRFISHTTSKAPTPGELVS